MIKLTRLKSHDHEFVLNADLIETVEETPDTVITLTNGKKLIVEEKKEEIINRVLEYRRAMFVNLR
ncbi:MAG: Flagellar protein [Firmicutes bacterium]|nr:Flagellar protein [Bacillota bacterium]